MVSDIIINRISNTKVDGPLESFRITCYAIHKFKYETILNPYWALMVCSSFLIAVAPWYAIMVYSIQNFFGIQSFFQSSANSLVVASFLPPLIERSLNSVLNPVSSVGISLTSVYPRQSATHLN